MIHNVNNLLAYCKVNEFEPPIYKPLVSFFKLKREITKLQNLPDYLTNYLHYCLQAVMVDKTLYISGQLGMGKDGHMVSGGTLSQAEQVLLIVSLL